ncbi:MAG: Translation initiation factor IF-3 [Chlamydiae bacterium]|nr:Translation initiation factor IF-3 [Chlamydiota bacterium]
MRFNRQPRPPSDNMRVNRQIRAQQVRVIDKDGKQLGVLPIQQAMTLAEADQLDLVEIAPTAQPPVCKIIDYGKFRYQQARKEKESKKAQHQVKVKEIKVKPNTDDHDLQVKLKRAREFIEKGNKVRITCMFRGREMAHPEVGRRVVKKLIEALSDIATSEAMPKQMGRSLSVTLAPGAKKIKENHREGENEVQKSGKSQV